MKNKVWGLGTKISTAFSKPLIYKTLTAQEPPEIFFIQPYFNP